MNLEKRKVFRSKRYLDWVKTLPCMLCMTEPCGDAHHLKGTGLMSGVGMTAPDSFVMPLCRKHHRQMHDTPELWPLQWEYVARTLARAIDDGVLVLK